MKVKQGCESIKKRRNKGVNCLLTNRYYSLLDIGGTLTWNPHLKLSNFPCIQRQFIWCIVTLISAYLVGFLSLHLQLPSSKTISLFILIKIHECSSSQYHRNWLKLFFLFFLDQPRFSCDNMIVFDFLFDPFKNMHQNFNQVNHKKPENIQLFRISCKLMSYQAPQKVELCSTTTSLPYF